MLSHRSCPTLGDAMDCNSPGSSVHGILPARILEWVAIPSSKGSSPPRGQSCISRASHAARASRASRASRVSRVSCIDRQVLYPSLEAILEALTASQKICRKFVQIKDQGRIAKEQKFWCEAVGVSVFLWLSWLTG